MAGNICLICIERKGMEKIKIEERKFTLVLTETEANWLVRRLKYREKHDPDLTERIWKPLESSLGYSVLESLE